MLFATAGSRFYISDRPVTDPTWDPATGAFVEIGETEALGILGVEWDVEDVTHLESPTIDDLPIEEVIKTKMRRPPMQVIFGIDPADLGQAMLWRAAYSGSPFGFRLILPDGATEREWSALVMTLTEVFDAANAVIRLQADLKATSEITRSTGG